MPDGYTMQDVELLEPTAQDVPELGRICYAAFRHISERHGFAPDFPDPETAAKVVGFIMGLPGSFKIAARINGRLVGSNFLLLTDEVAGVGPITVDPDYQSRGVGRRLMVASLDYARQHGFERVRLLQDSFNRASLSLYASFWDHVDLESLQQSLSCGIAFFV